MNWFTKLLAGLWVFATDILKLLVLRSQPTPEPAVLPVTPPVVSPPTKSAPSPISPAQELYETAKAHLGTDASPKDLAPDEDGCMESVDDIHFAAFGFYINNTKNKPTLSTAVGLSLLEKSPDFREVFKSEPGVVRICATGTGSYPHGHIGIDGLYGIMSNDSATGTFKENYTFESWHQYFEVKGGFKSRLFKPI